MAVIGKRAVNIRGDRVRAKDARERGFVVVTDGLGLGRGLGLERREQRKGSTMSPGPCLEDLLLEVG
jgi:hypothetical protein